MLLPPLFLHKYRPTLAADYKVNRAAVDVIMRLIATNTENLILYGDTIAGKTTMLNTIVAEYCANIPPDVIKGNVLHINTLTEQGIQFYRTEVKTFCQTCTPLRTAKYKYTKKLLIIDDFDQITEQSQQVFRNYIDNHSANVLFIFTCSSIQNVIDDIQSRMQTVVIPKPTRGELADFIDYIRADAAISMDPDVPDLILKLADGSIQLVFYYLEKFYILGEHVTRDVALGICSHISSYIFDEYIALLRTGQLKPAIDHIYALHEKGYSVIDILDTFFTYVKMTDTLTEDEKYAANEALCKFIAVFYNIHEDEIELAFFTNAIAGIVRDMKPTQPL